ILRGSVRRWNRPGPGRALLRLPPEGERFEPSPAERRGFLAQAAHSLGERASLTLSAPAGTEPARLPVKTKELRVLGSRDAHRLPYPTVWAISHLWDRTTRPGAVRTARGGSK